MAKSTHLVNQALADEATDPFLYLLTISHPDIPGGPLRFVRDKRQIVSRGNTFLPFPFDFAPPGQSDAGVTPARILIDNIDQRIVQTMRAIASPLTILVELVVASTPDRVEEALPPFLMRAGSGDRFQLQADLADDNDDNRPLCKPTWNFTPSLAPALF